MRIPLLTVGIPVYNAAEFLSDAIRSVFAQTYVDWELIIVDDGSTDGSREVAYSISDPRVKVVSDGVNRGLVARLNQITELALGRYLARMDADDMMDPTRLEKQVRVLNEHPEIDVVDSGLISVDEHGLPKGIRGIGPLAPDPENVMRNNMLLHASVMGRKSWFERFPYDCRYTRAEDQELWTRSWRDSTFARVQEPLYLYRESDHVSVRAYLESNRSVRQILRRYGPSLVGRKTTEFYVMRSHARCALYRGYGLFGAQGRLVRRRSRPLTVDESAEAARVIETIHQTKVPGLDA